MEIPIENIYYLLCYAWDKLTERDVVAVDSVDVTCLPDLFARVLINGTNHLLKRGFDRGYVAQREWTSRLRGRVCFQDVVRRAEMTAVLPCDADEVSYDVLHNQILKATMRRLIRTEGLAAQCSAGLAQLCRRLCDVQDVELTNRLFGQVQLYQNNRFYDFLLKVCELICRNLLPSEKSGTSKFMDFFQNQKEMGLLFESFVRSFYRIHTDYQVRREDIYWRWTAADQTSERLLPKMQTDISLTSSARKIIIDCKFTPEATQPHYGERLRSSHLYQIHAYLNNLPEGRLADICEVMLLYPTVELPLCASYKDDKGRRISIRTISLSQPWQGIHRDLLALVA
jgi:5-methylcytosine-specific restriction enzyme subunit McrC